MIDRIARWWRRTVWPFLAQDILSSVGHALVVVGLMFGARWLLSGLYPFAYAPDLPLPEFFGGGVGCGFYWRRELVAAWRIGRHEFQLAKRWEGRARWRAFFGGLAVGGRKLADGWLDLVFPTVAFLIIGWLLLR